VAEAKDVERQAPAVVGRQRFEGGHRGACDAERERVVDAVGRQVPEHVGVAQPGRARVETRRARAVALAPRPVALRAVLGEQRFGARQRGPSRGRHAQAEARHGLVARGSAGGFHERGVGLRLDGALDVREGRAERGVPLARAEQGRGHGPRVRHEAELLPVLELAHDPPLPHGARVVAGHVLQQRDEPLRVAAVGGRGRRGGGAAAAAREDRAQRRRKHEIEMQLQFHRGEGTIARPRRSRKARRGPRRRSAGQPGGHAPARIRTRPPAPGRSRAPPAPDRRTR
jgi:hypothetical protein